MDRRQHLRGPTRQSTTGPLQLQRVDLQLPDRQVIKVNAKHRLDVREQRAGQIPNMTEHRDEHKHQNNVWPIALGCEQLVAICRCNADGQGSGGVEEPVQDPRPESQRVERDPLVDAVEHA
jgi:hypothetical protein